MNEKKKRIKAQLDNLWKYKYCKQKKWNEQEKFQVKNEFKYQTLYALHTYLLLYIYLICQSFFDGNNNNKW